MARIRTIKPEFWSNEQVAQCSIPARLLFLGLLNFCDDGGVIPASCHRLKMQVLPSDPHTAAEVGVMVDELIAVGLLGLYETAGKQFWYVTGWHHQKIDKPTYQHPGSRELGELAVHYRKNLLEKQPFPRRGLDEGSTRARRLLADGKESKGMERNGKESMGDCDGSSQEGQEETGSKPLGIEDHFWPYFVSSDKRQWTITEAHVEEWQRAYPYLNVRGECYRAHVWIKANWAKRKAYDAYPAFIVSWLAREQKEQRAPPVAIPNIKPIDPTAPIFVPKDRADRMKAAK